MKRAFLEYKNAPKLMLCSRTVTSRTDGFLGLCKPPVEKEAKMIDVYNRNGEIVAQTEIDEYFISVPVHNAALHQVATAQLANRRSGTASTKTRAEVKFSGRKLYRQKGTGRARAGSRASPTRVHGAVAFGPKPRSFRQRTPKKIRRLALRSALADKFQNDNVVILEALEMEQPKTKEMVGLLQTLNLDGKILFVLDDENKNVYYSVRNIPNVNTCVWNLLNTYDILWHGKLLMTQAAVEKLEQKFQGISETNRFASEQNSEELETTPEEQENIVAEETEEQQDEATVAEPAEEQSSAPVDETAEQQEEMPIEE